MMDTFLMNIEKLTRQSEIIETHEKFVPVLQPIVSLNPTDLD